MPSREELFDKIRPIVMLATGVPECILADPNAPSPNGPYCSIEPEASIDERGQANIHHSSTLWGQVETIIKTQLITQVEINFYRGDARTYAKRLKQANKRPSVSAMLHDAKLGWNRVSPVSDLTALQADQREQRAVVSIYIMYEEFDEPEIHNSIESVAWSVNDHNNNELTAGEAIRPEPVVIPNNSILYIESPLMFGGSFLIYTPLPQ